MDDEEETTFIIKESTKNALLQYLQDVPYRYSKPLIDVLDQLSELEDDEEDTA